MQPVQPGYWQPVQPGYWQSQAGWPQRPDMEGYGPPRGFGSSGGPFGFFGHLLRILGVILLVGLAFRFFRHRNGWSAARFNGPPQPPQPPTQAPG